MSSNRIPQSRGQSASQRSDRLEGSNSAVDHNELNAIIDTLLEVRHNIKPDQPEFGIKPVNLSEKQIEMLIEKS